jgi:ABC-2 type transport system ATP-binding protein
VAEPAIVIRGLTKRYGDIVALDALDLEVPAGSIHGFLGPNGAGKTTTLRLLTGLARPSAGTAAVAGVEVHPGDARLARSIGYLDQDPRPYGWMRGRELLGFVGQLYGLHGSALRARIDEVLAIVDMAAAADRRIAGYSGGMRQRIGLAAALLSRPAVLFLDEPVSALDPEGRHEILRVIAALRGTTTVLVSTHILNDVERVCDRVAILDHGRLVTAGPLDELLERHAMPVFRIQPESGSEALLPSLVDELRHEPWVTTVTVEHGVLRVQVADPRVSGRELVGALYRAGLGVDVLERQRPTLEDVFLHLVGGPEGIPGSELVRPQPGTEAAA